MKVNMTKKDSIVNKDIVSLESMDIDYVKKIFIDEIKSLEDISEISRNKRLQCILARLFKFQPSVSLSKFNFGESEQRLYADLVSIPELRDIMFFRDFLEKGFKSSCKNKEKKRVLIDILNYYDNHSEDVCEKFNYIFRSCDRVSCVLLNHDIDLDKYFSKRIMDSFDKEDLSQLFRFYFYYDEGISILDKLFDEENLDVLFLVSVMTKKSKALIGRSSEFLYSLLNFIPNEKFINLLKGYYSKYVGNRDNEQDFEDSILNGNNFCINELINYIIAYTYDINILNFDIDNTDNFIKKIYFNKINCHYSIFDKSSFDIGRYDFKKIETEDDLDQFKKVFLYAIYGISLEKAYGFYDYYCSYMDELELDVSEFDLKALEILKTIISIVDLDLYDRDFFKKIKLLQDIYLQFILDRGINFESRVESSVLLESLFNKMFINTYNKRLLKIDKLKIIEEVDGVKILDAGYSFKIMLTSLSKSNSFFEKEVNVASKWNTASFSTSQGLCLSYITEQNLGIISLESPILGFSYVPEYSLESMGSSDIFSSSNLYCLSFHNNMFNCSSRIYVPGCVMDSETRYGYNEILVDRFLLNDKKEYLKLQPDYVVFYKVDDNYKCTSLYKNSLKIAKDFNIPIVIIDVLKVKEKEQKEIMEMEEKLFSVSKCDSVLVNDIIVRYMNNYTGSLTLVGSDDYYSSYDKDFSVEGMIGFLNKIMIKVDELDDVNLKIEWINAIDRIYKKEKYKYERISRLSGWNFSVEYFILNKLGFELKIMLRKNKIDDIEEDGLDFKDDKFPEIILEDDTSCMFVDSDDYSLEIRTVIDFFQYINIGTKFNCEITDVFVGRNGFIISCERDKDSDINAIEDLVISYFFNNYDYDFVSELGKYNFKINMEFRGNEEEVGITKKEVNMDKLFLYLSRINDMSDIVFTDVFHPLIKKYSRGNVDEYNNLLDKMLMKKKNINEKFGELENKVKVKKK